MLAIERQRRILDLLNAAGSLRTTETSETLGVTHETVRKDFELLEKRGELIRIHGGASKPDKIRGDLPFTERQAIRREEKQAIARLAASPLPPCHHHQGGDQGAHAGGQVAVDHLDPGLGVRHGPMGQGCLRLGNVAMRAQRRGAAITTRPVGAAQA